MDKPSAVRAAERRIRAILADLEANSDVVVTQLNIAAYDATTLADSRPTYRREVEITIREPEPTYVPFET